MALKSDQIKEKGHHLEFWLLGCKLIGIDGRLDKPNFKAKKKSHKAEKKEHSRKERRRAKQDIECQPLYNKYKEYYW